MNWIDADPSQPNVTGTIDDDLIDLPAGQYAVQAGAGDDIVFIGDGEPGLSAGSTIEGDEGDDSLYLPSTGSGFTVVQAGSGNGASSIRIISVEHVIGSSGNDAFDMSTNHAGITINAGSGDDMMIGGSGDDWFDGNTGNDTVVLVTHIRDVAYSYSWGSGNFYSAATGNDTVAGVETIRFKDGYVTSDQDSHAAQAERLYMAATGHEADAATLDSLTHMLDDGSSLVTVANALLASSAVPAVLAASSNGDFVEALYNSALGRSAEPGGKAAWTAALDQGQSRGAVLAGISESAEHRGIVEATIENGLVVTNEAYQDVASLYDTFAGRLPDQGGLDYWAGALLSGSLTLDQVAAGFAASGEFVGHIIGMSQSQIVDYMYHTALHRDPDTAGKAWWVNALEHGMSYGQLMESFAFSAEHMSMISANIDRGVNFI